MSNYQARRLRQYPEPKTDMSEKKYPAKVRFKGVIDGMENPVFGHHVTCERVDMYVNTEIKPPLWIYACDVVNGFPDKFEPVVDSNENPAKWTDADMVAFGRSCWSPIKGAKRPKNSCGFRTTLIEECLSRFKESRHD